MNKEETVECKFCKEQTTFIYTQMCNNCYEVTNRLKKFMQSKIGMRYAIALVFEVYGRVRIVGSARQSQFNHVNIELWTSNPYPENETEIRQANIIAINHILNLTSEKLP